MRLHSKTSAQDVDAPTGEDNIANSKPISYFGYGTDFLTITRWRRIVQQTYGTSPIQIPRQHISSFCGCFGIRLSGMKINSNLADPNLASMSPITRIMMAETFGNGYNGFI